MADFMPLVSAIIATHNRAELLEEALQSVLTQTFRDVEIIVVDDGSTDHTPIVMEHYADRVKHVRYENRGRAHAVNSGIMLSTGEYVAFLDDDDIWLPHKLELQVAPLEQDELVDVVYSPRLVYERGSSRPVDWARPTSEISPESLIEGNWIGNPSVILVRRTTLDRVALFDQSVWPCDDWELLIRIALNGGRFHFVPEPLAKYRLHDGNTTEFSINAGYVAVLNKLFEAPDTPKFLRRKLRHCLSRRLLVVGFDSYRAGDLGRAWQALLRALSLDPALLRPRLRFQMLESLVVKTLRVARRAKKALFELRRAVASQPFQESVCLR